MAIETPASHDRPTAWTADRIRTAAQDVRARVAAAVAELRRGAAPSARDLDDVCRALVEITQGLQGAPEHLRGRGVAPAIREASSAIGTSHDLVALLLADLRAAGPGG